MVVQSLDVKLARVLRLITHKAIIVATPNISTRSLNRVDGDF